MAIVAQNRIGAHLGIAFRLISRLWRRELAKDLLQRLIIEVVGGPIGVLARRRLELLAAKADYERAVSMWHGAGR